MRGQPLQFVAGEPVGQLSLLSIEGIGSNNRISALTRHHHHKSTTPRHKDCWWNQKCRGSQGLRTGNKDSPVYHQEVCERNSRSALFTDSESGKISCKSGAISTTFAPSRNRLVCFPRTPDLMSSSGYSSRILSLSLFIGFALTRCHFTGGYDADPVTPLSIGYNEATKCRSSAECQIPEFAGPEIAFCITDRYHGKASITGPDPGKGGRNTLHQSAAGQCIATRKD